MKHKWHKEIIHWANGGFIEKQQLNGLWTLCPHPEWYEYQDFRILQEPQPKKIEFKVNDGGTGTELCDSLQKPMTRNYKETIIERLRTDDEFWNEVFSAYDKKCDDELGIVYEHKEPQYLHVYQDVSIDANNYLLRTSFIEEPNVAIYIGKIKLEVED